MRDVKPSLAFFRRLRAAHLPAAILVTLLQRTPVVRVVEAVDEMVAASPVGALLRSAAAAAATLGALNSMAGATTLQSNVSSPENATVGTAISQVAFGVTGALSQPGSWLITSIPPGLSVVDPGGQSATLSGSGGGTNASNPVLTGTPTTAGTFNMTLVAYQNANQGGVKSPTYTFTVVVSASASAPSFSTQPQDATVNAGQAVSFTAAASGSPTYQWRLNGSAISGATSATLTIGSPQTSDAGTYTVVATNSSGSTTSAGATLTVVSASAAPVFTVQPISQTVDQGVTVNFNASATGAVSYQWKKDGANISGQTSSTLVVSNAQVGASASNPGYTVVATNANGSTTSSAATLAVNSSGLPVITTQPTGQSAVVGQTVVLTVAATNGPRYQWYLNSSKIAGATNDTLTLSNVQISASGTYTVTADNTMTTPGIYGDMTTGGSVTSNAAVLSVSAVGAPAFTTQPQSQSANVGQTVTFTAAASGSPTFRWQFNTVDISGATSATLTLPNVQLSAAGNYSVVATNSGGTATSNTAVLTVSVAAVAPSFTTQPTSQIIASGTTVVFTAAASGVPAPSFQWKFNNAAINGATGAQLVIMGATAANAGSYACTATNSSGLATSNPATLTVTSTTNPGRLVNLSILTQIQDLLTVGVVVGGSGVIGNQSLLIRAVGPTLGTTFGYPGAMPDPAVTVIRQNGGVNVGANAGWKTSSDGGSAALNVAAATGAFPLLNPSLDSVVVASLPPVSGGYSIQVKGSSNDAGSVIAEIYDNTPNYTATSPRLVNLSSLKQISVGGSLAMGFVVGGSTSKTLLIRAAGPALIGFGYPSSAVMADPKIVVQQQNNGAILATNAGWGGNTQLSAVAAAVQAFAFTDVSSKDSAVVLTLPPVPGGYSATVSSASGGGGNVIVEVYEVP